MNRNDIKFVVELVSISLLTALVTVLIIVLIFRKDLVIKTPDNPQKAELFEEGDLSEWDCSFDEEEYKRLEKDLMFANAHNATLCVGANKTMSKKREKK